MAERGHNEIGMPSPQGAVAALGYAREPARRRWRWRHAVLAGVLVGSLAGSWTMGRSARAHVQHVLYEQQVAQHVEPADTVAYEPVPSRAARLARAGTHTIDERSGAALIEEPASYVEFAETLRHQIDDAYVDRTGAIVFLHELSTAGGAKRIVAVRFLPWVLDEATQWQPGAAAGLVAKIYEPGGLFGKTRYVGTSTAPILRPALPLLTADEAIAAGLSPAGRFGPVDASGGLLHPRPYLGGGSANPAAIRWYAGRPDVTDSAHFTVDFEYGGRRGTVDGYLSADGSAVHMNVRPELPGPARDDRAPASTVSHDAA